ncbi:AsmA-like C-terminal region-containing protein [Mangrovibacterium marinum]|uniref:AsmA-like protein n=1 Tax=Mangrovibacterium marinum TaxID=1639118 RepID=A0A2T5C086_9BACT|nr:AsmA-like C-terminal region-containing protein [Mangrovibacterium marinum]PTN08006.1 AsmA-like protein [Mangrovibacterium marinum]
MKKVLLIIVLLFVVLLGSAILVPVLFKGPLLAKISRTINKNLNAKVEFEDFSLSIFKGFPKIQAELTGLTITGKNQFEEDTLLAVQSVSTNLSLSDLFNSEQMAINTIRLDRAKLYLLSTLDGLANWDIAKDSGSESSTEAAQSTLNLSLQSIELRNFSLTYKDEATTTVVQLKNATADASGQVEGTVTTFNLSSEIDEFVLEYDSVQYISKTRLKAVSQLTADYDKMVFTFGDSHLFLNDLPLDLTGRFEMPSDSMYFDLKLIQPQSNFKSLLALVPQTYQSYLDDVKANGDAGFEANIKGWFYDDNYPAIDSRLYIANADFQYQDFPEKVSQIALESSISKPQGELDLLQIEISQAHAQIRNNPVDLKLLLTQPMSDPAFDASLNGKIDFTSLGKVIPMDSIRLSGVVQGNVRLKGTLSAVEAQDFSRINSNGTFTLDKVHIETPQLSQTVELNSGSVKIDNQQIAVSSFNAKTGQSDFTLNGQLSNYLPYFFTNKTLKGSFNLQSNYLNLDELANIMVEDTVETTSAGDSIMAFHVPGNLDLSFRSNIKRATFDRMNIENIEGVILVKNQMLQLQKLDMNMLGGQLTIDGNYVNNEANQPDFDFNVNINAFEIPAAYQSFPTMQRYAPIASKSSGKISSQFKFKGKLNEALELMPSSLNGAGLLSTQSLQIVNSPTFDQIKNFVKKEKLQNVKINDFTSNFKLENGNLLVNPFTTRIADQDVTISGKVLVDQTLDLALDFNVNKDDLASDILKTLSYIPGSSNIAKLDVGVAVTGQMKSPKVALDLSKAKDQIANEFKKSSQEEIQKSVKKLGDELKKLFK